MTIHKKYEHDFSLEKFNANYLPVTKTPQFRIFEIRWLYPTDTKGLRLKIIDTRQRRKPSFTIPFRSDRGEALAQVEKILKLAGIKNFAGYGSIGEVDYLFTKDFGSLRTGAKADFLNGKKIEFK